jgi:hypothetical protein
MNPPDQPTVAEGLPNEGHESPWTDYFATLRCLTIPNAFMTDRPLNAESSAHGVFDDERPNRS